MIKRLSDRTVQNASCHGKIPRYLPAGAGLYLQVSPTGTKSWVFRYSVKGREQYMGLGPFPDVSLADARAAANDCRKLRRQDVDPIDHRAGERAEALLAAACEVCNTIMMTWADSEIQIFRAKKSIEEATRQYLFLGRAASG